MMRRRRRRRGKEDMLGYSSEICEFDGFGGGGGGGI